MKRVIDFILIVCPFIFPSVLPATDFSTRPVIIVMDASGSMGKSFHGISRIQAAKYIINEQLAVLDSSKPLGLVAYGNGISGCNSERLYVPVGTGNRKKISSSVLSMRSSGNSPIHASLDLVEKKILPHEKNSMILLISDGAESCGGNPESAAERILQKYPDVRIHVIGLSVEPPDSLELAKIAQKGNGKFYDVKTSRDFSLAINETIGNGELKNHFDDDAENLSDFKKEVPVLQLNAVNIIDKNADFIRMKISYEIKGIQKGDYAVNISGLVSGPVNPWNTVPENTYRRVSSEPVALYGISAGKGDLEIEFPLKEIQNLPILLQGELWEITKIPYLLGISNKLAVYNR